MRGGEASGGDVLQDGALADDRDGTEGDRAPHGEGLHGLHAPGALAEALLAHRRRPLPPVPRDGADHPRGGDAHDAAQELRGRAPRPRPHRARVRTLLSLSLSHTHKILGYLFSDLIILIIDFVDTIRITNII